MKRLLDKNENLKKGNRKLVDTESAEWLEGKRFEASATAITERTAAAA
jgi:hypothetical protein